jgi:long-chain acyl-CoA synthetase
MADGGKLVLMARWDAEHAVDLIWREAVTSFSGVPTMIQQVLALAEQSGRQFQSIETIAYSGAPAPPTLAERVAQVFPNALVGSGYGLTESSGLVSCAWGEDLLLRPDSVGFALPGVEVRILGPEGEEMRPGQLGEIQVRGPGVMQGYWGNPQATEQAIVEGWLRTGDIGRLGRDGRLYVVDRLKDVIIRGGENVYSVEVESALEAHPAVAEAAVVGQPHPDLGEEVVAFVRLCEGAIATDGDLNAFASQLLARFKLPARIEWRRSPLPRNPSGKLMKARLRAELWAGDRV